MNIVMIGCGAVGKATILYWDRILPHIQYEQFTIIEPEDLPPIITRGKTHWKDRLTPTNYHRVLNKLNPHLIIDLSVYVGCVSIVNWAFTHGVMYISTAIEDWGNKKHWDMEDEDIYESTLLIDQRSLLALNMYDGPTILLDHGMNPGLISHFTKLSLEKMCHKEKFPTDSYPQMARDLGVEVIQCSEVDTQRVNIKPNPSVFYNTWSCIGYYEEGTSPVQVGWGSHEKEIPDAVVDIEQRFLYQRGMDCRLRGHNPLVGEYVGLCIPHGESASISRYLTIDGYRPSSYYVYKSSPISLESLERVRENNYEMLSDYHVVTCDEIKDGADAVGALLMRENGKCYWGGTIIRKSDVPKEFRPYINPTTVQVACGVLAGIDYVINNPNKGVIFPEEVESHRVLELTERYLGEVRFEYVGCNLPHNFVDLLV